MKDLMPLASRVADRLKARRETVAVAESSAGGLIAASLLAVPGASAYFLGGAVVYTKQARQALLQIDDAAMHGLRSASEPYAALLARTIRERHRATWGLSETGAAGPSGNRYGDAAVLTLATGLTDRETNMRRFATHALQTLLDALEL
jgi:nicotinamide-nucleotide amidase